MRVARKLIRKSGTKLLRRLIIIVSEGEKTEVQYFEGLQHLDKYKEISILVEIIDRENSGSDPASLLRALKKYRSLNKLNLRSQDQELWQVCDIDRWEEKMLSQIAKECLQSGIGLAISNPCFEAWLLLHLNHDFEEAQLSNLTCKQLESKIRQILGSYNKSNIRMEDFSQGINQAIEAARSLDKPNHRWPQSFGSKVFNLMESLEQEN